MRHRQKLDHRVLGLGLLYSFIYALGAPPGRTRSLLGWSTGGWQALLNVTWEGSGLFSAMIGTFFVMKVVWGRMNRSYFPLYLGWALPGLTSLLLYTKTYHSLAPYALLAWGAPLFAGLAIGADYTYRYFAAKSGHSFLGFHRLSPGIVAVGSATLVAVGLFSIFVLHTIPLSDVLATLWDNVQSPLGGSRLMLSVGELYDPHSTDWVEWYGISFLVIVAGSTLVVGRTARAWTGDPWVGATLWLVFVGGTVYSRFSPESLSHNPEFSQGIFVAVLVLLGLVLGVGTWWASLRYQPLGSNSGELNTDRQSLVIIWFTILLLAARGAQRYHLFLAPVAAAFLAHAFVFSIQTSWGYHRLGRRTWRWAVVLILSVCIGFLSVTAIHRSLAWVHAAQPVLSRPWRNTLAWMKQSLPAESVVAAWWDYGSILNLLGGQTTIIDQNHFIPYWIHLMARNVFCASDDEEALTFLRTHQATHLAISSQELASTRTISVIGSDENLDRQTMPPVYLISTPSPPTRPEEEVTTIKFSAVRPVSADFPLSIQGGQSLAAGEWFVRAGRCELGKNGAVIDASMEVGTTDGRVHIARPQRVHLEHQVLDQKNATLPGTLVLFTATDETAWHAFYVSEKTAELLGVRLLLLGEETPGFQRIYPTSSDERFSQVAIWEIHYPSSILSNSAYLGTEFPNNALRRSWMRGGE